MDQRKNTQDPPLVLLYTGPGKGKTTAAFGQALRAVGHGWRVCIIQFLKAKKDTGEVLAAARLAPELEVHVTGAGFTWQAGEEKTRAAGLAGWELAKAKITSGDYRMVILDEITYLCNRGIIPEEAIFELLATTPHPPHLVLTGRDASPFLCQRADLVTVMQPEKHHLDAGRKAMAGIEF